MRDSEEIAAVMPPIQVARAVAQALDGIGLRWMFGDRMASIDAPVDIQVAMGCQPSAPGGPVLLRLLKRDDDPRQAKADAHLPLDAAPAALGAAARRVLRDAQARAELKRRRAAANAVGLVSAAPSAFGPARALYHGVAHPGLLAIEKELARAGVEFCAALTPVSTFDAVAERKIDAILLDARPGDDRVLSILRATQRNPAARSMPRFVVASRGEPGLHLKATESGAQGAWPLGAMSDGTLAGWIVAGIEAHRRARAVDSGLRMLGDAAMANTPRAQTYRDAYLALCFAENARTSVFAVPNPTHNGAPARRNELVSLARRMVRTNDAVFWHDALGLLIVAVSQDNAFGPLLTTRLRTISQGFGVDLHRIVHLRVAKGSPPAGVTQRLRELIETRQALVADS